MKFLNTVLVRAQNNKRLLGASGLSIFSAFAIWQFTRRLLRPRQQSAKDQPPDQVVDLANGLVSNANTYASHTPLSSRSLTSPPRRALSNILKHKRVVELLALIIATALAVAYFWPQKPTRYVAYIGKYRTSGSGFDDLHVSALGKFLDELSAEFPDYRLELKPFSIKVGDDKYDSRPVYEEIANDDKIVAVIDNSWGVDISSVADLIRARGIPVISINADRQNENYSKNVVFIGYDDDVPEKFARFSKDILKKSEVIFVAEDSYKLTGSYEAWFEKSGITYAKISAKSSKVTPDELKALLGSLDAKLDEFQQSAERPTVVINTHSDWGGPLIEHIDKYHNGVTILGGPYIMPSAPTYTFGSNDNGNNLIVFTYPHDVVTNKLFDDLESIKAENSDVSKLANAPLFMKRCLDAVSIVRAVLQKEADQKTVISKGNFLDFFHNDLANEKVAGRYDLYTFDNNLLLEDGRSFEEYSRQGVVSYRKQLNQKNEVISTIYFGLHDMKISNIDLKNGSFHAAFNLWVPVNEPDLRGLINFKNKKTEQFESRADITNGYYRMPVSDDFNMDVDVKRYPLDTQEPSIALQIINPSADAFHISFDDGGENRMLCDNEWEMEGVRITTDNEIYSLPDKELQKITTLNLRMKVSRRWGSQFLVIIFPLVMMGVVAVAVLYVKDGSFANLGNVGVGIFMGMLTYSFAYAQMTPHSDALTVADELFYATFLTVLLIFMKVIIFSSSLVSDRARRYIDDKTIPIGNAAIIGYLLTVVVIILFG